MIEDEPLISENFIVQKELASALVKFQSSIPEIKKSKTARVKTKTGIEYSYKYADLADIWAAIRKPLSDNKLAVMQLLDGGTNGNTVLHTIVFHESGQLLSSALDIPTAEKTPQESGSLFTYYKRYALSATLGIATEEDDDGQAANKPPARSPSLQASASKAASDKQINLIRGFLHQLDVPKEKRDEYVAKVKTSKQASEMIEQLQAKVDAKKEAA